MATEQEDREQYRAFYNADDPNRVGRDEMPEQLAITARWLEARVPKNGIVLELGCGKGALSRIHPGWIGLDFSLPALLSHRVALPRMQGDMQRLPVRDASVDAVFSWAAIEHVPNPELAIAEIARVVRPGGLCVLAPAWNVRPWASRALPIRSYADLPIDDRLRKASIPVREHIVWRAFASMPGRLWREMAMLLGRRVPFTYTRLDPNMTSYEYTDSDAFTSMDPHAAVAFFHSRGWQVLSHPSPLQRLLARHDPVVAARPEK